MSAEDVVSATEHAARTGVPLVEAVVAFGLLSEPVAYRALAAAIDRPFVDLTAQAPTPMTLRLVPERVARRHQIVPLSEDNRTLTYASCVGADDDVERDLAFASGRRPAVVIATKSQVIGAIAAAYAHANDVEELINRIRHAGAVKSGDIENADRRTDSPVVDLCNRILAAAINAGASDIHLEPGSDGAVIRHRVCGILEPLLSLPAAALGPVTNRFKILAGTDITTKRKPQDGAFRVSIDGRPIDVRLSALPTTHGEKLVMRVIDSGTSFQTFDDLGYNAEASAQIRAALSKPDGLVLMTGPTGSGKTTALYAALHFLRTGRVNIVTVEDPVERHLEGVSQIPVNSRSGNGFASVLRSVMRQDPNVIMVGEIRDNEVADIVGQAAFTGHLVLSSLHTSDAASAITRLLNLGLAPFKVAESLNAVVAQRLVRKLCTNCRTIHDEHSAKRLGALAGLPSLAASPGKGCDQCKQTGYRGRVAVPEVLIPDEALRAAIRDGAGAREIRAAMRAAGCPSMRETALALAVAGITSLEEIDRVLSNHDEGTPAAPVVRDKIRVLVTDDDRMIRMLIRLLLEKDGYEVLEAENGAKGLEIARRERPDLLLIDLMMPDMDGFEVLGRVRHDLILAAVPVMVLTAETGSGVEQRVLELGADDYLVKPFEADVLLSRVRSVMRRVARTAAA
ncbi:MAG TPA: type II/IV secretion system protein [Vicinamibacterales bacterium]|nr:type II/IV secretion system protein [Vicinamibacterales bacterium]